MGVWEETNMSDWKKVALKRIVSYCLATGIMLTTKDIRLLAICLNTSFDFVKVETKEVHNI